MRICVKPIGTVARSGDDTSTLELDGALVDGLLGVKPGDRLDVLYWMHELAAEKRQILQCHPRGDLSRPITGVFALRSPMRPNPIGVTSVEVISIDGASLRVRGLDAKDGSPIIDLKRTVRPKD